MQAPPHRKPRGAAITGALRDALSPAESSCYCLRQCLLQEPAAKRCDFSLRRGEDRVTEDCRPAPLPDTEPGDGTGRDTRASAARNSTDGAEKAPGARRRPRRRKGKRGGKAAPSPANAAAPCAPSDVAKPAVGKPDRATRDQGPKSRRNPRQNGSGDGAPLYAALDLGTNNCRLLIARPTDGGFAVVDAFSRIVRLGEGIATEGRISDGAMQRAIDALSICAEKIRRRGVRRSRIVATEACRTASNGEVFARRVKEETGLMLDVVTPEDEARLAVAGCAPLVDRECEAALVFDIGGGSTELMWIEPNGKRVPDILDWTSLPYGVVTLAERYGGVDVSEELFQTMVSDVRGRLGDFSGKRPYRPDAPFHLLGTSGTVTTIAGVHMGLRRYDRNRVDGTWIGLGDVQDVTGRLLAMDYDARAENPCIGRERADLVLAGCAILAAIVETWPSERLRVADRGLREGILLSLMQKDRRRRRRTRRRGGRRRSPGSGAQAADTGA